MWALLFIAGAALAPSSSADSSVAIVKVHVLTMRSDEILRDHAVIVRDGRIAWIGPSAEASTEDVDLVVEAPGRYLMPGLADMHVHTWRDADLPLFVAYGVTTVRNMFGRPVQLDMRRRIQSGQLLGPTIVTAGPILDGDPPVWNGSQVVTSSASAIRAARGQQNAGYDFLKVYVGLQAPVYEALLAEAARLGLPVAGHVPRNVGLDRVLLSTQRSIEHLDQYASLLQTDPARQGDTSLPISSWLTAEPAMMPDLARRFAESGVWSTPTLVLWEKWATASPEVELARPEARYVSPELVAIWQRNALSPDVAKRVRDGQPMRLAMTGALAAADAPILMGTDVGNPYIIPGFSAHEELERLVASGMTPYEALSAATREPAVFLGQPRQFGTIDVGLRADLLLLEANPLEDIRATRLRKGVMIGGRWLPRAELDAMLEDLARSFGPR